LRRDSWVHRSKISLCGRSRCPANKLEWPAPSQVLHHATMNTVIRTQVVTLALTVRNGLRVTTNNLLVDARSINFHPVGITNYVILRSDVYITTFAARHERCRCHRSSSLSEVSVTALKNGQVAFATKLSSWVAPASPEGSADAPSKVLPGLSWQHRSAVGVCTLPAVPSLELARMGEPTAFLPGYGAQVAPFTSASPFGAVSAGLSRPRPSPSRRR
jgi:hypothetical protein